MDFSRSTVLFVLRTYKSYGDGGRAKRQVEVTTGSRSPEPARRRPVDKWSFFLVLGQQGSPAASQVSEQPV